MTRIYNPKLIEIRNNPFPSTRSVAISDGIYMRDLKDDKGKYESNAEPYVEIGFILKLLKKIEEIEKAKSPQHLLIMGEYGQGKSFALKKLQDTLYNKYNGGIIGFSIGISVDDLLADTDFFPNRVMENIEDLFTLLDEELYIEKSRIEIKYNFSEEKTLIQFLQDYDKAFKDLNILVYIFVDELDKIIISGAPDVKIKHFIETLKTIGDSCNKSISTIIAGTTNCLFKMDQLSIDYAQRYDKIEFDYLTKEECKFYINEKCKTKLKYSGYCPFDTWVKKQIYRLTSGNVRKVEILCRKLWIYAAQKQAKIERRNFTKFLKELLYERLKSLIGRESTDNLINFVVLIYESNGALGVKSATRNLSRSKITEVNRFVERGLIVDKVRQTYKLKIEVIETIQQTIF